jgi:hypothetical protein
MPASAYQPLLFATKNPVWFVFGVQSRASRTVVGSAGVAADGDRDPAAQPVTRQAATARAARVRRGFTLTRFLALSLRRGTPSGEPGRRRVGGPASFAGTSQIRFRGSVVEPHSQR